MAIVLIANRGEIARRVIRTARRMGLRTVAVYSDADSTAPFVKEADQAVRIGPPSARDSYLNSDAVIGAAIVSRADLLHPGYGFLSEQATFADAVAAAGLTFVGPPATVLRLLGDKAAAKAAAERAGIPVLPGYRGSDQTDAAFGHAAAATGYPVLIKPAFGGGGIGMQLVPAASALGEALARARRTAQAAFGDERLILERAIERPRHIEIQILADSHGTVIALGERDCSAQRRHQKVLEETPSPMIDDPLRQRLSDAAIALAKAVGYVNAGTCEFLVDPSGAFFFLEANARLQVEHPVTEEVWGIDLVEQQLRIAQGEPLAIEPVAPHGHAVEVRLYAEDPPTGFLPSSGRISYLEWAGGARIDSGIDLGSLVTADYDPLLAKVIVHAADRDTALSSLDEVLKQSKVLGVRTNKGFLRRLLAHPAVRAGAIDTDLIARSPELAAGPGDPPDEVYAIAGAAFAETALAGRDAADPWTALGGWRVGGSPTLTVVLDGRATVVGGSGPFTVGGHTLAREERASRWRMDGRPAVAVRDGDQIWVVWRGETFVVDFAQRERSVEAFGGSDIVAPMPGVVLSLYAGADQRVKRGDLIGVIEAMKMELRIVAPADGLVKRVLCAPGDQVRRGQRLAEFEPA